MALNLVNVPAPQAAKTVLGDILGVKYTVDPSIEGKITIQTPNPVTKSAAIDLFQSALRSNGAGIVNSNGSGIDIAHVPVKETSNGLFCWRLLGPASGIPPSLCGSHGESFLQALAKQDVALSQWFKKAASRNAPLVALPDDPAKLGPILKTNQRDIGGDVIVELGFQLLAASTGREADMAGLYCGSDMRVL